MSRLIILVLVWIVGAPPVASGQERQAPDFKVEVWGFAVADFSKKIDAYVELRQGLEQGLPGLKVTDKPAEIVRAEDMLAIRIRQARRHAQRGDIFTPSIRRAFRDLLRKPTTPGTCELIRDDNPGEFGYDINATYPKVQPVSTVPASMLAVLPRLPLDIEYRFLGRDLILHDLKANIIIDRMEHAIRCPPSSGY